VLDSWLPALLGLVIVTIVTLTFICFKKQPDSFEVLENGHFHYQKVKLLGKGAYGVVYKYKKCRNQGAPEYKAIKFIQFGDLKSSNSALREANRLNDVQHANVVRCTDQFLVQERGWFSPYQMCIVMDLVGEGDLSTLLSQMLDDGKHFQEVEVLRISLQIADVLEHLHSKEIIHRDLKPENVFVNPSEHDADGGMHIKVGDLGLAHKSQENRKAWHVHHHWQNPNPEAPNKPLTQGTKTLTRGSDHCTMSIDGCPTGTCGYIAPELWAGYALDYPIDVWSFGIVLFDLASTGKDVMSVMEHSGTRFTEEEERWGDPALVFARQWKQAAESPKGSSRSRGGSDGSPRARAGSALDRPVRFTHTCGTSSLSSTRSHGLGLPALAALTNFDRVASMCSVGELLEQALCVDHVSRIKALDLKEKIQGLIDALLFPVSRKTVQGFDALNATFDATAHRGNTRGGALSPSHTKLGSKKGSLLAAALGASPAPDTVSQDEGMERTSLSAANPSKTSRTKQDSLLAAAAVPTSDNSHGQNHHGAKKGSLLAAALAGAKKGSLLAAAAQGAAAEDGPDERVSFP